MEHAAFQLVSLDEKALSGGGGDEEGMLGT